MSKKTEMFEKRGLALAGRNPLQTSAAGLPRIGQPKFQSKYRRLSPEERKKKQFEIARETILQMRKK